MPIPTLGEISGNDITTLIESLEKQRKELAFVLSNLDTSNVLELNAEVINAGVINAKHVSIGTETTYEAGFSPGDLRIEMETQFTVIDGEISAMVLQEDFDALGNRVASAESSLSVLPGQIALKVSQEDFNALGQRVSTAESSLSVLPGQIALKVSQQDFNALGQRVSTAESSLSVLPGQISSKVSSTDYTGNTIASLINQSATTITIQASKISLVGAVSVLSDITGNLGTITSGTLLVDTNATVGNSLDIGRVYDNGDKKLTFRAALGDASITFRPQYDEIRIAAFNTITLSATEIDFGGAQIRGFTTTAVLG